jgi:hypothetical protein
MVRNSSKITLLGALLLLFPPLLLTSCGGAFFNAILIPDAALEPGETQSISIVASRILPGLQGIEVSTVAGDFLTFDFQIIEVVNVQAVEPFSLDAVNVDNANGRISFIARTPATGPFPTDGTIVEIVVKGLKPGISPIDLSITNLADPDNLPLIGVRVVSGSVMVGRKAPLD